MGGFVLHTRDWTPFPIDAKQLHYLVTRGYVKFPMITKRMIADKNKVDVLLRLLTLGQILWFVINICGRAAQQLAITCGELTTAAFIVCSVGTTFCWARKPADIETSEIIETNATIAEILLRAGDQASQPYSRTPLDFVSRKEWPWSLYWSNWINILRNIGIVFGPRIRPVNRFENTTCFEISGRLYLLSIGLSAVYSAIFIAGWNYSFPTKIEQRLWRAASVTMMGCLIAYYFITKFAFTAYPAIRNFLAPQITEKHDFRDFPPSRQGAGHKWIVRKAKSVAASIRNNSVSGDPALDVPLKAILPIYVVGVFYCHARTYIFIADIIELRALPPSAFLNVDWWKFIPHL
ncbi:hypothetical protein MMC08_006289 [Hypocenomyce scalaris]|nr:hypothetical protein [Hypocenomyce scalaris]